MFGFGRSEKTEFSDFEREALPLFDDVFRYAVWLVRDRSVAEDLTQETFEQALRSFHGYRRGTNCKAWLLKILYHVNGRRFRKMNRLRIVDGLEEEIAETVAFEPSIPHGITEPEVLAALRKIPEKFSQVVVLADVEDFAYREIAQLLDLPIGTVMSRLHRGRKLLRGELAAYARQFGINDRKTGGKAL